MKDFDSGQKKKNIGNLILNSILTIGIVLGFSTSLMGLPNLGNLLFPGEGIWKISNDLTYDETLSVANMDDTVEIYLDDWGVPHIYATTEKDALFSMGYLHAENRLFMMDLVRRLTAGNLAEVMGDYALDYDKLNLAMLKSYWAEQTYEYYQQQALTDPFVALQLELMERYVDGINHYIENCEVFPLEFHLLNYEPEPWTLVDSLLLVKYMAEDLTWRFTDLYNYVIWENLGESQFAYFYNTTRPYQIPVCPNYGNYSNSALPILSESNENFLETKPSLSLQNSIESLIKNIEKIPYVKNEELLRNGIGSNNWVVNGNKTITGAPILCNDMHLGWTLPPIWYQAHIVVTDPENPLNIWGFTLPGYPYPLAGHNEHVGWGLTNTNFDVIDWYYYEAINSTHYLYKNEPTPYKILEFDIPLMSGDTETFRVNTTVHGPVFTDFLGKEYLDENFSNPQIACKWLAHNISLELFAFHGFAHASNRAEFDSASQYFWTPAQNIIYADIDGNIGIRPTGKVPIRDDTGIPPWHYGNGTMPYNGTAGQGEWIDYILFENLPHTENPSQNYLASANQISAGPAYTTQYHLQNNYAVGYRARRINNVLSTGSDLDISDMQILQLDLRSEKAANLIPPLLALMANQSSLTAPQQSIYDALLTWDYEMETASYEATIFQAWSEILLEKIFGDEFDVAEIPEYLWFVDDTNMEYLVKEDTNSPWFDNVSTSTIETMTEIVLNAIDLTFELLADYYNTEEITQWKWGEIHYAQFDHLTGLAAFGVGPFPAPGTGYTVNPMYGTIYQDGKIQIATSYGGASERMIIDFSNFSRSLSVIPGGQSGQSHSPHYQDQLAMFLAGEYHPNYFQITTEEEFKKEWITRTIYIRRADL